LAPKKANALPRGKIGGAQNIMDCHELRRSATLGYALGRGMQLSDGPLLDEMVQEVLREEMARTGGEAAIRAHHSSEDNS
jgi:hypothetical protein